MYFSDLDPLLSEPPRRHSRYFLEDPAEVCLILETGLSCYLIDRHSRACQEPACHLHTVAGKIIPWRYPHLAAEDSRKVILRYVHAFCHLPPYDGTGGVFIKVYYGFLDHGPCERRKNLTSAENADETRYELLCITDSAVAYEEIRIKKYAFNLFLSETVLADENRSG